MAEWDLDDNSALLNLEEELTCSICLSPFDCPVTIPCGHNFCQNCILATWNNAYYSCPQCRTLFATKPELKKNTVLSTVVETLNMKSGNKRGQDLPKVEDKVTEKPAILCDTCMGAEAYKTCLTCMASFCVEHVRPHQENPIYRAHQLNDPLGDLQERICPDHHKLMEFFCVQHNRCICSLCLQQVHKGCSFSTPDEQRGLIESDLRGKLNVLDGKIEKNKVVISEIADLQKKLKDSATNKKRALETEYRQMRELLERDEREALLRVDVELESGQARIQGVSKKLLQNVEKMSDTKHEINSLLGQSQALTFLQASVVLPSVTSFDPHAPRISLDSKVVTAGQAFSACMNEYLRHVLSQPVEARLQILKPELKTGLLPPGDNAAPPQGSSVGQTFPPPLFSVYQGDNAAPPQGSSVGQMFPPSLCGVYQGAMFQPPPYPPHMRSHSPGAPLKAGQRKPQQKHKNPPHAPKEKKEKMSKAESVDDVRRADQFRGRPPKDPRETRGLDSVPPGCYGKYIPHGGPQTPPDPRPANRDPETVHDAKRPGPTLPPWLEDMAPLIGEMLLRSELPADFTSPAKRQDLLQYGEALTLDPKTAHKRISLSEDFTKATVSDEATPYPDGPARFAVCSQVLATQGFSSGRHYWEVKMSNNNFTGLGLAYSSMDRKGPTSRLGRNEQSWCVEWFNVKLSAWHANKETLLTNPNPKRVGVLVDCDQGTATFYSVAGQAFPFHTFVFPFAEAVYPAFWMFSSGSSVNLCKVKD